jgi:glyoxylase I family protein
MDADVLFAGIAVADFQDARAWYERLFGRAPDVVAHDEEVMWQITDRGWLYILRDAERAGNSIVAMAVSDIEGTISLLERRGVTAGAIQPEGDAGRKAVILDPAGNRVEIIEVAAGGS